MCVSQRVAFYFWQHFMQKLNALRDFALILACSKEDELEWAEERRVWGSSVRVCVCV